MSNQTDYVVYLNSLTNQIIYYGLWTILPTCVVGNLVSLFIYTRPNLNKKTNTGFLYSWLCILNLITIIYYCLVFRGNTLFNYPVNWPCGMDNFFRRTALNSITWIQVVICLDRFISVFYPTKRNWIDKKNYLVGIMLACMALILVTNTTNLITYTVTDANNVTYCFMTNNLNVVTNLIAVFMRFLIPYIIMLTLNLLVIFRLKHSKIRASFSNSIRSGSGSQEQPLRQLTKKQFRFIVSTLIIDFIFLFFYFPLGVNYAIATYNLFSTSLTSDSFCNAVFNLFSNLTQLLALAHTSVLFLIFVVFNRIFRTELIVLLRIDKFFPTLVSENTPNTNRNNNNNNNTTF